MRSPYLVRALIIIFGVVPLSMLAWGSVPQLFSLNVSFGSVVFALGIATRLAGFFAISRFAFEENLLSFRRKTALSYILLFAMVIASLTPVALDSGVNLWRVLAMSAIATEVCCIVYVGRHIQSVPPTH